MIVNMTLKRILDFHGHLCPDIVLGAKFCEYVQQLLGPHEHENNIMTIIAENSTSALDAIQIMLGVTVGNQRLKVIDFGKHNYTLIPKKPGHRSYRLALIPRQYPDETEYNQLEQNILTGAVRLEEVARFQELLDERVKRLLNQSPEKLFAVTAITAKPHPIETASVYLTCCRCNEPVLKNRVVAYRDNIYCSPCFQMINTNGKRFYLH